MAKKDARLKSIDKLLDSQRIRRLIDELAGVLDKYLIKKPRYRNKSMSTGIVQRTER